MTASFQKKIEKLREVISENLRVQQESDPVDYISVGTALQDAKAKQNHTIFARRGCGKTLLLRHSARNFNPDMKCIYLNCEDFKRHSFPNVLIEILSSIFKELDRNFTGWFGKKKKLKDIVKNILDKLENLQRFSDTRDEEIKRKTSHDNSLSLESGVEVDKVKFGSGLTYKNGSETEVQFKSHYDKLQDLDLWLPDLKQNMRKIFEMSNLIKGIILQIDDLYHLKRADQAFVVDYIHRLCKGLPVFFKIATLRHASTLYLERDGQPIGAQERHDYQPINIDYTFSDFNKTLNQNQAILNQFSKKVGFSEEDTRNLFKGEAFSRLVMAGGGVPRDVLSLFLELLNENVSTDSDSIGKDDVRLLSRQNFERKIEELKQDSKTEEQEDLIKGIYIIRKFCLDKRSNIFLIEERMMQQRDEWRALIYRLLDYRIIHSCATAFTNKSMPGTYQAFAVDIGCYAHMRKLSGKFKEIDVSLPDSKEKMRSSPILGRDEIDKILKEIPKNPEVEIFNNV